eukprot:415633_1
MLHVAGPYEGSFYTLLYIAVALIITVFVCLFAARDIYKRSEETKNNNENIKKWSFRQNAAVEEVPCVMDEASYKSKDITDMNKSVPHQKQMTTYIETCQYPMDITNAFQCDNDNCHSAKALVNILINDIKEQSNQANLCLSYFLHQITLHNVDESFEFIYNQLDVCDIKKCQFFNRNYRNRHVPTITSNNVIENVNQQIMDKIHCYYYHSYDIGYRLTGKEKNMVNEIEENEIKNTENYCVDRRLTKLNEILLPKHKIYRSIRNIKSNKFISPLGANIDDNKNDQHQNEKDKMYSYGYEFIYEKRFDCDEVIIPTRYMSLKEELTQNQLCVISIQQFKNEFAKAQQYFNTEYRKKYKPYILVNHLLSVIIYCNFDELQKHLSETYRKMTSNESFLELFD